VGRAREWRALTGLLAAGDGFVALSGDPGMGKSTLLADLAAHAAVPVLAGRVGEFERSIPFGVFADALGERWRLGLDTDLSAVGRFALHREIRAVLERLAPVLLILDDLHWADAASLDLAQHLARHRPAGVMVVCAFRPKQFRLSQLRFECTQVVELSPLSRQDAARLLGRPVSPELHAASGGNPFYLEALASGSASLEAALHAEIDALTPECGHLLRVAAVTGDPFDLRVVAEVAELAVEEALTLLDELVSADLVRCDQRAYHFRHPIVRNVAYHSATAALRHNAHQRAAALLERLGAPAEARAHHVEHAAAHGDTRAVAVLTSAASGVVHRAPATAAHWYATALALLPDADQWEARWGHARALGLSGRLQESRGALHDLLSALPADHAIRPEVVAFCAHVERALGLHAEVRALAARELESTSDTTAAAVLKLALSVSLLQVMEKPEVIHALLDDVLAVARASGDTVLEAGALAVVALSGGDVGGLVRAARAVDGATDAAVASRLESVVWVAWSELRQGRNRESLRHYERALSVAYSTGQHHMLGNLLLGRANALRWLGCLDDACEGAAESAEVASFSGSRDLHTLTLAVHSWLLTLRGHHAEGLAVARRAVEVSRTIEGWHPTIARLRIGHALLAAGEHDAAVVEIVTAGGGAGLPKVPRTYRPEFYELLVQATADETWARRAEEIAHLPGCRGFAELAWTQVLLARNDFTEAERRAANATALFEEAGQRLEAGRARLLHGKALAAQGKKEAAGASLSLAQAAFRTCGAPVVSPQPAANTAVLTQREREVAELVGEGLTNRQVARRLSMAEKTVEGHLSRIFTKLDVPSRAGLARLLAAR